MAVQRGTLKSWHDAKGFGFIRPDAGGADVFIHIKDFKQDNYRPLAGGAIHYRVKKDDSGRPKAYDAIMAQTDFKVAKKTMPPIAWLLILLPFLLSLAALYVLHVVWPLLAYLTMSAIAVAAYAHDKKKAKTGTWRTTESFLHWIELLGGWPGALFAQHQIRHKNNKASYQAVFWAIVVLHLGSWGYYVLAHYTHMDLGHSLQWLPADKNWPAWNMHATQNIFNL